MYWRTWMKITYTAHGTASAGGRGRGHSETDDGKISVSFSTPKEMGGDGGPGTNPEQLFAVGYSACFLGAMHTAARRQQKKLPEDTTVTAAVSFADREDNVGFAIVAALSAKVPGMEKAEVEALMKSAHDICPYSNLIRFPHEVELTAA
jgi:osmotically inducible protein OsmC